MLNKRCQPEKYAYFWFHFCKSFQEWAKPICWESERWCSVRWDTQLTEKGRGHAWGWEEMFHSLRGTGFPECKPLADVKVGTGERTCQGLMYRLVTCVQSLDSHKGARGDLTAELTFDDLLHPPHTLPTPIIINKI